MAGRKDRSSEMPEGPFNNPFGGLSSLRAELSEGSRAAKPKPPAPVRAVVRLERKGRGGREVTVISHLELKPNVLEIWAKSLKNELGCGGGVEADTIILQGDQRERVRPALEARGIGKVTVG